MPTAGLRLKRIRVNANLSCRDVESLSRVVAEKNGVQVAHVEHVKEKTVIVIENGKETGKSISEYLHVTKANVEGVAKDMPVIGRWKSKDGDVFYLALGAILDEKGTPIATPAK